MATPRPKAINHRFTDAEWEELETARIAEGFRSVTAYVAASALSRARGAKKASVPAAPAWEMT